MVDFILNYLCRINDDAIIWRQHAPIRYDAILCLHHCVEYTNCIMEYGGTQYYLYKETCYFSRGRFYGLLPMDSADYDYLYENSMEDDYSNRYEPFAYILNEDYAYETGYESYVLVKVEE